jgi:cytochrome P450
MIQSQATISLTSAAFIADPYPTYAWLREHAPVYFSEEWQGFALTRYSDVLAALRDPRLSAHRVPSGASQSSAAMQERLAPSLRFFSRWALFADPPQHTRLRGLLNRAFLPKLIEAMRPRLQNLVDELLAALLPRSEQVGNDSAPAEGSLDVIAGLAAPLPMLVIGEILGLPRGDWPALKPWSNAMAAFLGARQKNPEVLEQLCDAIAQLEQYFRAHIRARREGPAQEDLLQALLSAEEHGALLSEDELIATCGLALFAGNETTADLIGSAVWLLTQHPAAQARLREKPEQIPAFIEEALRLESPVQRTGRVAAEDFSLHEQPIRKGQRVWLMIGSASRDEAQFANANTLDLDRGDSRHLAFGYGSHFCVGAALARLEAQLAISSLLRVLPDVTLDSEPPVRIDNLMVRGFKRLRLRLRPQGAAGTEPTPP